MTMPPKSVKGAEKVDRDLLTALAAQLLNPLIQALREGMSTATKAEGGRGRPAGAAKWDPKEQREVVKLVNDHMREMTVENHSTKFWDMIADMHYAEHGKRRPGTAIKAQILYAIPNSFVHWARDGSGEPPHVTTALGIRDYYQTEFNGVADPKANHKVYEQILEARFRGPFSPIGSTMASPPLVAPFSPPPSSALAGATTGLSRRLHPVYPPAGVLSDKVMPPTTMRASESWVEIGSDGVPVFCRPPRTLAAQRGLTEATQHARAHTTENKLLGLLKGMVRGGSNAGVKRRRDEDVPPPIIGPPRSYQHAERDVDIFIGIISRYDSAEGEKLEGLRDAGFGISQLLQVVKFDEVGSKPRTTKPRTQAMPTILDPPAHTIATAYNSPMVGEASASMASSDSTSGAQVSSAAVETGLVTPWFPAPAPSGDAAMATRRACKSAPSLEASQASGVIEDAPANPSRPLVTPIARARRENAGKNSRQDA